MVGHDSVVVVDSGDAGVSTGDLAKASLASGKPLQLLMP